MVLAVLRQNPRRPTHRSMTTDSTTTDPLAPKPEAVMRVLVEEREAFLAFLERRTGDRALAEDILQDAFARGLDRLDSLRDGESAVAWFYRILRNAVIDHHRRRSSAAKAPDGFAAAEAPQLGGSVPSTCSTRRTIRANALPEPTFVTRRPKLLLSLSMTPRTVAPSGFIRSARSSDSRSAFYRTTRCVSASAA